VVLSLGLAPGLSNLLAAAAANELDTVESIEIGLLMGTGDDHGSAAIAWSTHNMFDPKAPRDDAQINFGSDFGVRRAHFMDFADQHVLARTMPGVRTVTRATYDSALLSRLLFWLGRTFAGNATMEKLVERVSHMPTFGSDKCVLSVTAHGQREGRHVAQDAFFLGQREAAVTAAVAVLAAEEVLAGRVSRGVHHSHQVLDGPAIFAALERLGHGRVLLSGLRPAAGV
jgi:saccharopine dehydrogenase-like NADP-dependent oxidoreductase